MISMNWDNKPEDYRYLDAGKRNTELSSRMWPRIQENKESRKRPFTYPPNINIEEISTCKNGNPAQIRI